MQHPIDTRRRAESVDASFLARLAKNLATQDLLIAVYLTLLLAAVLTATGPDRDLSIRTVIVAVITSNLRLADAPGNAPIGAKEAGLSKPSVVNVSQLLTLDRSFLRSRSGRLKPATLEAVDRGLHLVLSLAER